MIEIEKVIEKMVEKQQIVELETMVPQLVKVHEIIKEYIDKIVAVHTREEIIKQVTVEVEKIVQITNTDVEYREIEVIKNVPITNEVFKEYTNIVNHIERDVQVVDRFEQKEVAVYTTVEKIVEVPQILEKIVERIVIMPQIVEVLKYVHEIYEEETLGVALSGDVAIVEGRYRELYGVAKKQLEILLVELRTLRTSNPNFRAVIEMIEKYLVEFDRLASAQRIVTVNQERIVEKEVQRGVLVPSHDLRGEYAYSLLIEKLLISLKTIKKANPNINLGLDQELSSIFFTEFESQGTNKLSGDFQSSLKKYTEDAIRKHTINGGEWTSDHEIMLHSVFTERFAVANLVKQANE